MDLSTDVLREHYRHPYGKERLASPSVTRAELNPSCGDAVTVDLIITDMAVEHVGWDGSGCTISQAAMSVLTEHIEGKTVEAVLAIKATDIVTLLGVPVSARRSKCALLCLHAVHNALHALKGKPTVPWRDTLADFPAADSQDKN